MEPIIVSADQVARVRNRFSENVTANRLIQLSALSCLHHITLTWGFDAIAVRDWAEMAYQGLMAVAPNYAARVASLTLEDDLVHSADGLGQIENGVLRIERPIFLAVPAGHEAEVVRLSGEMLLRQEIILSSRWPRPRLHLKALAEGRQREQEIHDRYKHLPYSCFIGTAGTARQEIRERISDRLSKVQQHLDLMMAYVKPEEGIISLRSVVLRLLDSHRLIVRMLLRDEELNLWFVNRLIDELRLTAVALGKTDQVDNAQQRVLVRFAPKVGDTHLHAKLWIFDHSAVVVSSANLIPTSMSTNYEAGVYSEDLGVVDGARQFFDAAWQHYDPGVS